MIVGIGKETNTKDIVLRHLIKLVWKEFFQSNVNSFLWRVLLDRVLTKGNL